MLFFAVFLLFSFLILRLGVVQIVYGDDYKREIERTEDQIVNNPVPRGKMFDRTGKIIVDNIPQNAITYTNSGAKQEEMLNTAKKLAEIIVKDTKKVQERDKKDFWILENPERANAKISETEKKQLAEKYKDKEEYDKEYYKLLLARVTDEEIKELNSNDLEVLAIYREFTGGYAFTPQIIKNKEVTAKEFAIVSENLQSLPGVDTTTDWERSYTFGSTLKTVLGNVSSSEEGLPADLVDYYLSKDYSRNDRVGKSYIELQYEDVLHGQKAKVKYVKDKSGKVVETQQISEGQRGKDLVLTIDMDLQLAVEGIIEDELWATKRNYGGTYFLDRAFVVLMDPYTGEVLTMAGKQIAKDSKTGQTKMQDFALGNITTSYNVGSAVKGATILTGYQTGAISPGTVITDAPMQIKGTPVKKSWQTMGNINDLRALQKSSNVYMFKTAIAIGKGNYAYNQPLSVEPQAFSTIRDSFGQFGLGTRTGIDLPNEMVGFKGSSTLPGYLLDLSIGQYDTYTTMQLAQYVSTIANGGYRVQPHIVKEIREPMLNNEELGPIIEEVQPTILNKLDLKDEWISRVQQGFRLVMTGDGTGAGAFGSASYSPAGKTGTAQAFYDGPERSKYDEPPEVMNVSLVSYAPYDNPEVAMAVIVPWVYTGSSGPSPNLTIGRKVLDTYFELKKTRNVEQNSVQKIKNNKENENTNVDNE